MDMVTRQEVEAYLAAMYPDQTPAAGVSPSTIADVSARLARYTGRQDWGGQSERTEYHNGDSAFILTGYWPIVSVASIYDDTEHDFAAASLVAADEYFLMQSKAGESNGVIAVDYMLTAGVQNVKVTYTGGYASASVIPADLRRAAMMQIAYETQRQTPGRFVALPGSYNSSNTDGFEGTGLLGEVMLLADRYKRGVPYA